VRVLCAYAPSLATTLSLERYAPSAEYVDVGGDEYAYSRVLGERWDGAEDLVVVEHDIELHAAVIPVFDVCSEPWCAFPYRMNVNTPPKCVALGCARFTAEAQRAVPFADVLAQPVTVNGSWRYLDTAVAQAFAKAGIECHVHQPPVRHRGFAP
jgi:hypothetical protein